MPKIAPTGWKTVTGLLLLGALPALPAGFIISLVFIGEPHEFLKPVYIGRPLPIAIHAISGILFWVLMPFQFSPRLRQRWPAWHRRSGRVAVMAAMLLGASSIWLVVFFPHVGGALRQANLWLSGLGIFATVGAALWFACRRNIRRHRAWMMRTVAIVYGAATTAIFGIPLFVIMGEFPVWITEIDRWVGLGVNIAIVEWRLHRESRDKPEADARAKQICIQ